MILAWVHDSEDIVTGLVDGWCSLIRVWPNYPGALCNADAETCHRCCAGYPALGLIDWSWVPMQTRRQGVQARLIPLSLRGFARSSLTPYYVRSIEVSNKSALNNPE